MEGGIIGNQNDLVELRNFKFDLDLMNVSCAETTWTKPKSRSFVEQDFKILFCSMTLFIHKAIYWYFVYPIFDDDDKTIK